MVGRILEWIGFPGIVKPFEYRGEGDCVVSLRTSPRYSILTVNGRELFFCRESGRYDGDGAMAMSAALPTQRCRRAGTPRLVVVPGGADQPLQS